MKAQKIRNIGVIMDGNRRWAKAHLLETILGGHERGAEKFVEFCEWCRDYDIEHVTVFAFSYENWNRSKFETEGLFRLMENFYVKKINYCIQNKAKIHIVGDWSLMSKRSQDVLHEAEKVTSDLREHTIHAAVSYGGRNEYVRMAKKIAADVKDGKLNIDDINQDTIRSYLDLGDAPDIDLVIRTGGDKRLSGFFPFQTAYSELYFLDTLWPDLTREMFDDVIKQYYSKVRINKGK